MSAESYRAFVFNNINLVRLQLVGIVLATFQYVTLPNTTAHLDVGRSLTDRYDITCAIVQHTGLLGTG